MPRVKLPRKSTHVDMTAFCDVAFLLLSFFMLATKFKPTEAVEIKPPGSVSSDIIPDKDMIMVSFDKDGKVYFSMDPEAKSDNTDPKSPKVKMQVIQAMNQTYNLGLTDEQMVSFVKSAGVGVPFTQLKSFLDMNVEEQGKVKPDGIPTDSTNNELKFWLREALAAFAQTRRETNLLIKGDNATKYPAFKNVIKTFKDLDQYKFKLITQPEDVPVNSEKFREDLKKARESK